LCGDYIGFHLRYNLRYAFTHMFFYIQQLRLLKD
jgi:hypothetical protein